jgi:hypothetical protein
MTQTVHRHVFNTDLLIHELDRRTVRASSYSSLEDVLHDPELITCFVKHDELANKAKRKARVGVGLQLF